VTARTTGRRGRPRGVERSSVVREDGRFRHAGVPCLISGHAHRITVWGVSSYIATCIAIRHTRPYKCLLRSGLQRTSASIYRVTATDARFLLKRLARLIAIAEHLANEASAAPEDQQLFDMLKAEIETIRRLQKIQKL
jgi:hypothetical protein